MMPVLRRGGLAIPPTPWLDRMFEDVDRAFREAANEARQANSLPLSIWSDDENLHVEVEAPGVSQDQIEATVHEGRLYLCYERTVDEGRKFLHDSRRHGRFEGVVALPEPVDVDKIQASLNNGVLHLTLPKSAEAKPKRIQIQ